MIFINTTAVSKLFLLAVRVTLSRRTQDKVRIIAGTLSEVRIVLFWSLLSSTVLRESSYYQPCPQSLADPMLVQRTVSVWEELFQGLSGGIGNKVFGFCVLCSKLLAPQSTWT